MELKKILIFNTAQANDIIGGSQNALEDAICVLIKNQIEVYYISSAYNIFQYQNTITNLNRIYIRRISKKPFSFLLDFTRTLRILIKIDFDIVWVNSAKPWLFFKNFINPKKLIYTFHGPILEEQKYSNRNQLKIILSKYLYKSLIKNVQLIHYNTLYVKNSVETEFPFVINKANIVQEVLVSENIVLEKFGKNSKFHIQNNKFNILIPRRLVNRTGVINFVKMLFDLDSILYNKFFFYITGNGPQLNEIKSLIQFSDNIKYMGELPEDEFNSLFYNVDAICIPSIAAEGFCLPAKIAYLLNKPVLHTGQGGLNETLFGYNKSYTFDYNNSSSLSLSLSKLLNETSINKNLTQKIEMNFEYRLFNMFNS